MDKEQLFKPRLLEDTVPVPGIGDVRVRSMSRTEVARYRDTESTADRERIMLADGMVDPELTEDEAAKWMAAAPAGELTPVLDKITALSFPPAKETYKSVRGRSRSGVRVLPSGEAGDDGGSAAAGDDAG